MVLNAWRAMPDRTVLDGEALGLGPLEMRGDKVALGDQVRAQLKAWQDASGIGAVRLLKDAEREGATLPQNLKPPMIVQWISGATKIARPEHLEFVALRWAKAAERGLDWVEITAVELERLKALREAGLLPSRILKNAPDKPDGLTSAVISNWLSGKVKRARKDYLEWVISS